MRKDPRAATSKRGTVLLVDDDDALLRSVARLLRQNGLDVTCAQTAAEARRAGDCAVGVFDIDLGCDSGIDLAEEMLATRGVGRAIFFSGSVDHRTLNRAREIGAVVSKGEGAAPLIELVHRLLAE